MRLEVAVSLLLDICLRILGLAIIIAESTVSHKLRRQRKYIKEQRDVMKEIQEDINLYFMLGEIE